MKKIKMLAVVGVLGLAVGAFAFTHLGGARGHGVHGQLTDAASVVDHLAEMFPRFAAFDQNKDGRFDSAEMESLAKAMADGILQLPGHQPPTGVEPGAEAMLAHFGKVYAQFAVYDVNRDGAFEATEQSAIKIAIEKGDLAWPPGSTRTQH